MSEPIRLAKRLMEQTHCSRREAEFYIKGGYVRVNGQLVLLPQHLVTNETVVLAKEAVAEPPKAASLLCHLPPGMTADAYLSKINASKHWQDDPCEQRTLSSHFYRLQEGLPLTEGHSGLVVLSQDPGCLRKLHDDRTKLEQEFAVSVKGDMRDNGLKRLNQPLNFQAYGFQRCKVSWLSDKILRFAVKNPVPGQIEDMCATQGLEVEQVKRLRIAAVSLGKVPAGQWRYLAQGNRF